MLPSHFRMKGADPILLPCSSVPSLRIAGVALDIYPTIQVCKMSPTPTIPAHSEVLIDLMNVMPLTKGQKRLRRCFPNLLGLALGMFLTRNQA